jgi:predicted metal-dependent hydrolase
MNTIFWLENMKRPLGDISVDGEVILKWILRKLGEKV